MKFISLIISLLFPAAALALSPQARERAVSAYHAMTPAAVEAHPAASPPSGSEWTRVDVSEKIRSASFGHTTTLLIAPDGDRFYVEYGRSTNRPASCYGPFSVHH